ncbi:MAG: hypothetical protein PHH35_02415 [Candidatus Pacebacteria bacterium]|nr:hypothetical protein [Candidatus Paceibacterota bacterium]
MIKAILETIKRYLPEKLKFYLYLVKKQNFFTYFKIKSQIKKNINIRLLIGYEGKKEGWFSLGFSKQNDIYLNKKIKKIKICVPDNSITEIYMDDFLRRLDSEQVGFYFREIFRVLKPNGLFRIKYLDVDKTISMFIKNPSYFINEQFWNKKTINGELAPLNILSNLLFQKESKHLLNTDTVISLLKQYKFDIAQIKDDKELFSIIESKKPENVSDRVNTRIFKTSEDKKDIPIYLYNCDSLSILEKFKNIDLGKLQGRNFASVIGSLFFINLLPYLRPKKIYLFDVNVYQVRYMKVFVEIVKHSNNFQEFLENLFSRKYQADISKFLKSPFDKTIYNKNLERTEDREIFKLTIEKIAHGEYVLLDGVYPSLRIADNSLCQHILIMQQELFIPGPEANIMVLQEGFFEHFDYIKEKLIKDTIIEIGCLEDFKTVDFVQQSNGILYVSNIGEDDWLHEDLMDQDLETLLFQSKLLKYPKAIKEQIENSFKGFHKFIQEINHNFWIIDSRGNIFNSQELLKERSDSHQWLWQKVQSLIVGNKTIELIHTKKNIWGFKEHLTTVNINDYFKHLPEEGFSTIIFHMVLSNHISIETFIKALKVASRRCKRIIILEHDKDSLNFGVHSGHQIINLNNLLRVLRLVPEIEKSEITIHWSGSSYRKDERIYGVKANFNRNVIITIDL